MKFIIEQVALYPRDPVAARKLLADMGMSDWADDHVMAKGNVMDTDAFGNKFSWEGLTNEADLAFNYSGIAGKELEILHYTKGQHWMQMHPNSVSHLGMHCTGEELENWRLFFAERNIAVAQEVLTLSHTNPVIAGKRCYNYVIFDTRDILGVDLKFIVRLGEQ